MPIAKTESDLQGKIERALTGMVMTADDGEGGEVSYALFKGTLTPGFNGNTGISSDDPVKGDKYSKPIQVNNGSGMKAIIAGISEAIISHITEELEILQHERYDKLEEDYNMLLSQMVNVVTQLNLTSVAFVAGTKAQTTAPLAAVGPLLAATATALQATIDAAGKATRQSYTVEQIGKESAAGNVVK